LPGILLVLNYLLLLGVAINTNYSDKDYMEGISLLHILGLLILLIKARPYIGKYFEDRAWSEKEFPFRLIILQINIRLYISKPILPDFILSIRSLYLIAIRRYNLLIRAIIIVRAGILEGYLRLKLRIYYREYII